MYVDWQSTKKEDQSWSGQFIESCTTQQLSRTEKVQIGSPQGSNWYKDNY